MDNARGVLLNNAVAPVPTQQAMHTGRLASGFEPFDGFAPATAPSPGVFQVIGSDFSQVLEIEVEPGQTVTAEPGTMCYMSPGIGMGADFGSLGQACKRSCCAGEAAVRLHLINRTSEVQRVGITPKFPAKILPIDLAQHSGMIVNRGAFLAAMGSDWRVDLKMAGSAGAACCGGQGLFMNTLHGQGMAFLNAGGTVMQKHLAQGEEFIVDHHSVLAFEKSVKLDVRRTGGCMVCCCAGQGLFNAVLTGPGFVMVHTMALAKLQKAVGSAGGGGSNNNGANSGGGS